MAAGRGRAASAPAAPAVGRGRLGAPGGEALSVSRVCLGTMLFGEGTARPDAHRMLDAAFEAGVSFFDSAEMYPVPQRRATAGASERILGAWLRGQARDAVQVATKVAGPSGQMDWIRGGPERLDAANIRAAAEGSLARLGVDCIDLLQLHWPDRYVPMFGAVAYNPARRYEPVPLEEQLGALADLRREGKIRHVGLSNETPYGLMRCCELARTDSRYPKVVSLQNAYSLLCRGFDAGLAECCVEEGVSLLPYSPLAMGLLTGKYAAGGGPPTARLNKYKGRYAEAESRYGPRPDVVAAVDAYAAVAREAGLSPLELALRFALNHPLAGSAVIGASDLGQLRAILALPLEAPLSADVMARVEQVHREFPSPCP